MTQTLSLKVDLKSFSFSIESTRFQRKSLSSCDCNKPHLVKSQLYLLRIFEDCVLWIRRNLPLFCFQLEDWAVFSKSSNMSVAFSIKLLATGFFNTVFSYVSWVINSLFKTGLVKDKTNKVSNTYRTGISNWSWSCGSTWIGSRYFSTNDGSARLSTLKLWELK